MVPQGSVLLNTQVFASLTARINAAQTCAELQAATTEALDSLIAIKAAITAQIALLAPILALLTAPTNPTALITWVGNFITSFLTPYVVPHATYLIQLTDMAAQVTSLVSAITAKEAAFAGCTITIPSY